MERTTGPLMLHCQPFFMMMRHVIFLLLLLNAHLSTSQTTNINRNNRDRNRGRDNRGFSSGSANAPNAPCPNSCRGNGICDASNKHLNVVSAHKLDKLLRTSGAADSASPESSLLHCAQPHYAVSFFFLSSFYSTKFPLAHCTPLSLPLPTNPPLPPLLSHPSHPSHHPSASASKDSRGRTAPSRSVPLVPPGLTTPQQSTQLTTSLSAPTEAGATARPGFASAKRATSRVRPARGRPARTSAPCTGFARPCPSWPPWWILESSLPPAPPPPSAPTGTAPSATTTTA